MNLHVSRLNAYKGQQSCERGFRLLKDPLFFADSVFLKYPSRVETLNYFSKHCQKYYILSG